jgi:Fur family ferric uptake transcriptional regulator
MDTHTRADRFASVRQQLRERGLRWTPQRRRIVDVLSEARGHITAAEIVERCRAVDPTTIPSTVYRTLDVLEELGLVRHGHGADGREEFHVGPEVERHGHLYCAVCGGRWELADAAADAVLEALAASTDGFEADLTHMTLVGRCGACARLSISG